MKNKDVKKLLHEQSARVLPDEKVKENIKRELDLAVPEQEYALAHGGTHAARANRRQAILTAVAIALVLALTLGILIPLLVNKGRSGLTGGDLGKFEQIRSTEDFYIFGAASVGSLLAAQGESGTAKTLSARAVPLAAAFAAEGADAQQDVIDAVNGYMTLAEGLLGEGNIAHSAPQTPTDPADAQLYRLQTTISYRDLLGNTVDFVLLYNEVLTGFERGDETEEEYDIEGVLRIGNAPAQEYAVRGERETESEEDESEASLQFTAYREGKPYIRMEQETEQEENETEHKYSYTYYDVQTGSPTQRTLVEYEQEDGELELLIRVEKENGEKDELLFASGKQSGTLQARARLGDADDVYFTVYIEKGKYRYAFSDGSSFDDSRYDDDDGDDDDDDEDDDDDDRRRGKRAF